MSEEVAAQLRVDTDFGYAHGVRQRGDDRDQHYKELHLCGVAIDVAVAVEHKRREYNDAIDGQQARETAKQDG